MQLRRLTALEAEKIQAEHEDLAATKDERSTQRISPLLRM
jgi:DNA gyrase/topoisomerase IV subunit A